MPNRLAALSSRALSGLAGLVLATTSCDRFAKVTVVNPCPRPVDVRILANRSVADRAEAGARVSVPAGGEVPATTPLHDMDRVLVAEIVDAKGERRYVDVPHEGGSRSRVEVPREAC